MTHLQPKPPEVYFATLEASAQSQYKEILTLREASKTRTDQLDLMLESLRRIINETTEVVDTNQRLQENTTTQYPSHQITAEEIPT